MIGELIDRLRAVLSELAEVDVDELGDAELHAAVVALAELTSRQESAWCRLLRRWNDTGVWSGDGSRAAAARLARETHWRRNDCARMLCRAGDLGTMPVTAAAYADGEIGGAHVDLVASCNRPWRNAEFADSEALLVDTCRTRFFTVTQRAIEYWKQLADRDAADREGDAVKASRHLSASPGWRGQLVIDGVLDPIGGEIVKSELDRIAEQMRREDLRGATQRTAAQRRADALVEMATRSATVPANGLRPRPLFTVTIGIDPFNHLCQTAAGTVIAPGLLLPYLAEADVERIVYDPPNRRLNASRRTRFTGAVRRLIEVRDVHCQHPAGCDEPATRCDVDHVVPRSRGGVTCLCNGQLLCTFHNRIVKAAAEPVGATVHPCLHPGHHPHDRIATNNNSGRAPPAAG